MRARQFNVRMNQEEWKRAEAVAHKLGISVADTVRMLVKHEYDKISCTVRIVDEEGTFIKLCGAPMSRIWVHDQSRTLPFGFKVPPGKEYLTCSEHEHLFEDKGSELWPGHWKTS